MEQQTRQIGCLRQLALYLSWLIFVVGAAGAQSTARCPLDLTSVQLAPAHTTRMVVLPPDFSRNLERTLRIHYKNTSDKQIVSGQLSVRISRYVVGPLQAKTTYSDLNIPIAALVRPGQRKTVKQQVLTSGYPTRAWLLEVTFADGSRWQPTDPTECEYVQPRAATQVGIPLTSP